MTTTATPDIKQDHPESQASPTPGRDPTDTSREDAHSADKPAGRRIGSHPYDDVTQGRKIGSDPYDDVTQGRKIGSHPYDDVTQGRKIGSHPYDDVTQGR